MPEAAAEKLSAEQKIRQKQIKDKKDENHEKPTIYVVGTPQAIEKFYGRKGFSAIQGFSDYGNSTHAVIKRAIFVDKKNGDSFYLPSTHNTSIPLKETYHAIVVLLEKTLSNLAIGVQMIHDGNITEIKAKFDRPEALEDLNSILLTDRELAAKGISTYAELVAYIQADNTHDAAVAVKREKLSAILKALDINPSHGFLAALDERGLDQYIEAYRKLLQKQAENPAVADAHNAQASREAIVQKRIQLAALYGALGTLADDRLIDEHTEAQLDDLIAVIEDRVVEKRAADEQALKAAEAYDTFDAEENYREMVRGLAEKCEIELPEDFDFMRLDELRAFKSEIDEAVVERMNQASADAEISGDAESDEATDAHQEAAAMLAGENDGVVGHEYLVTPEEAADSFEKLDEAEIESATEAGRKAEVVVAGKLSAQFYGEKDASSLFGHSERAEKIARANDPRAPEYLDASL